LAVDCTTIPATLMESELFGHDRGAFSGAVSAKTGLVEAADRGTLFIDEVGELPLPMQGKLLRLLEEREFTRVGSTRTRKMEARVITATNRNLEHEVAGGRFRADLRYRLEVFLIESPPLRNRADDVFLLTAHFIAERSRALGKPEPRLNSKVIEMLQKYTFPGNVRELRNMVDQAVLLATGAELTIDEFPVLTRQPLGWPAPAFRPPPHSARPTGPSPLPNETEPPNVEVSAEASARPAATDRGPLSLAAIRSSAEADELQEVLAVLKAKGGNVSAAARALGQSRYRLLRILRKHGLR